MSVPERLWWAQCIESNRYRYNYGRQANRSLASLELPGDVPVWVEESRPPIIDPTPIREERIPISGIDTWKQFSIDSLFVLHRGGGHIRRESKAGDTPLVSASARNNGVTKRVAAEAKFPAGWITVCSNGSVGEAFVQAEPFVATADVTVLEPKVPAGIGARLFLCALIQHEKYRFNYGRKWPAGRMASSKIRAPVLPDGQPDLAFMEKFFETLPFSSFVAT